MRLLALLLVLVSAVLTGPSCAAGPAPARVQLLTGAVLIDGEGGPPRPGMSLLIRGDRIEAIFRDGARRPPAGAEVRSLAGRWVIPGLIDSHVHLGTFERDDRMLHALLRNALMGGVTLVRDMGGNGERIRPLAEAAEAGRLEAPRIRYATLVTGPGSDFWMGEGPGTYVNAGRPRGTAPWFRRVRGPQDAASAAAGARAFGATALKLHSGLDRATVEALCREARKNGLRVWGHSAIGPVSASEAVEAGVQSLTHGDLMAFEGVPGGPVSTGGRPFPPQALAALDATPVDGPAMDRLLRRMKARGAMLEPTLYIVAGAVAGAQTDQQKTDYGRRLAYAAAVARRAHAMGVPVVAGTDSMGTYSPNIHAELQLLVSRAGLTPLEAITAATRTAARQLGMEDSTGTLAAGKRADLVILTRDPSVDIRNTQAVEAVMIGGRLLTRDGPMRIPPLAEAPPQAQ
jgi:imidazolonepropionase-like amidohydrolase